MDSHFKFDSFAILTPINPPLRAGRKHRGGVNKIRYRRIFKAGFTFETAPRGMDVEMEREIYPEGLSILLGLTLFLSQLI